jgi:type I restriction enzyme M protein
MADNRKELERQELHSKLWAICNDLRGSINGWDFKQYVLGIMFYRFISENLASYINKNEREAGNTAFNYADLDDASAEAARDYMIKTKGFFILPSQLFENVCKRAADDPNLNETLEAVFKAINDSANGTDSEANFSGLFDDINVNDKRLGNTVAKRNERIVKLLRGVASMEFGENYQENAIDAFGDAYEYLMGLYAANAGKVGGEYFTPQEVSELLCRLTTIGKTQVDKVYDPACGSGSLLLKFAKILGAENVRKGFYGQEYEPTTYNLCRINMFLHDIGYNKFDIACEDTMINPQHWDEVPFDAIVCNPPYSHKWVGDGNPLLINDPRFAPAGVLAPKNYEDFAFILHCLNWLSANGTAAIVCWPGIMYRGGAEQKIRKYLIDNNYIDAIIQMPENLFFGVTISVCVMILKKNKTENSTLFIDAASECVKVTNANKLTDTNIANIVKLFTDRANVDHISAVIPNTVIGDSDHKYDLQVSTYVQPEEDAPIDILQINNEIQRAVEQSTKLRSEIEAIISQIGVE